MSESLGSRFLLGTLLAAIVSGCALFYGRPVQKMSDTSAAIRAAKEVQADSLSADLYREANEWFMKARREYRFKNFKLASDYAEKARLLAERAEFEALRKGGVRTDAAPPLAPVPAPSPYQYPKPEGTPAEDYKEPQTPAQAPQGAPPAPTSSPGPASSPNAAPPPPPQTPG